MLRPTRHHQLPQTGKNGPPHLRQEGVSAYYPAGRRKLSFPRQPSQSETAAAHQWEASILWIPNPSNRLSGYHSPFKSKFPFLFSGFSCDLSQFACPELQFLWLILNKLTFAGKLTGYCIIRVNNNN